MLRNYVTTALRTLFRNRVFSLINILGLSVGVAAFLLITLYVYHELSFDRYHENSDRIYRVVENLRTENEMLTGATTPPPLGPALAREFPEVEAYVRFTKSDVLVRNGAYSSYERDCYAADSSVFDVFTFPLLRGDKKEALTKPYSAVFTESLAKKYFGNEDPMGRSLEIDGRTYKITGVVSDVPENSHFSFSMLTSFSTWSANNREFEMNEWYWDLFYTYILLKDEPGAADRLRAKMPAFIERNIPHKEMHYESLPLQPLGDIYLAKTRAQENGKRGNTGNLFILSAISLFILLIAAFNFVNLATARATRRVKEVGLRKVLGASQWMLIVQFLGESVLVSTVATLLGYAAAETSLPAFSHLVESPLTFAVFASPFFLWSGLAAIAVALGLLSGAYPALLISGFQPLQIFRPSRQDLFGHIGLRKILVASQFIISIALVSGTLLVYKQLNLLRNMDSGFRKETTLLLRYYGKQEVTQHLEAIKNDLKKIPEVASVTASHTVPGEVAVNLEAMMEGRQEIMSVTNINSNFIDPDFLPSYGIIMIAGRNFVPGSEADSSGFIINETAMNELGWTPENSIGRKVEQYNKAGTILGVCKDFHYRSLHHRIEPLLMSLSTPSMNTYKVLSVRVRTTDMPSLIKAVGNKWQQLVPALPYQYSFLDEDYDRLYKADTQLARIGGLFSALAIIVGCLGLLGLTSFSTERRAKEIGIRKILGATAPDVIFMLSKELIGLILIALLVATPFTYYLINRWLENFTEHIIVGPLIFLIAGASVLGIAWLTVSYVSFKAASSDPAEVLRTE